MRYKNIREEEIKNKVGQDFFVHFDTTKIVGNIDFCVSPSQSGFKTNPVRVPNPDRVEVSLLWAEAKTGDYNILAMFTQLILTIGKARTFDKFLPPAFLGAFDAKKIAFVPYNAIMDVFSMNDFNWNVTPSNHETKEFILIKERIEASLHANHYVYDFIKNEQELHFFIKNNLAKATESGKILIDKNNFVPIYLRWLDQVKPCINFDWVEGRKQNILDSDFYIADLFVDDKGTSAIDDDTPVSDNLFVVFRNSHYEITKENLKSLFNASIEFKDKSVYEQFWKKYKRPPLEEIQHHIIDRRDLLIPQDIRERKGAFFTPKKWVELSQQYIADVLGEDWQEEYYVWDCAAGTGNLLAGLTNKYNLWASTLDQSDVNVMHDRIEHGALLLKDHVFQFDFLNDDFSKLPQGLQDIINDDQKRKKLVVYINPPYAEGDTNSENKNTRSGVGFSKTYEKYKEVVGEVVGELFIQFLARIYKEIPTCKIATFSTLKYLNSPKSAKFRNFFKAKNEKGFISIGNSFDNVIGKFPIGFIIWNLEKNKDVFKHIECDVYDYSGTFSGNKSFVNYDDEKFLNDWLKTYYDKKNNKIGVLGFVANDFQNQKLVFITTNGRGHHEANITLFNLKEYLIYFSIRHIFEHTWLNHNDQFLFPNINYQTDTEFQNDCLTFALFYEKNQIKSVDGINHWIPFTEQEVDAKEKFESNFMTQFIKGKIKQEQTVDLFSSTPTQSGFKTLTGLEEFPEQGFKTLTGLKELEFSETATAVFDAGRELWIYYHNPNRVQNPVRVNVNASLYDIREHFQGRNPAGKMNNKSQDPIYMQRITALRESLKMLAKKIEPKVYEYGFLKI